MKPLRMISIVLAIVVVASLAASRPASAAVSFDFFYSNLSHHGSWLVSGSYGRVWQPSVYHAGWNPYYDGHWQYTDAGWCWDSDYEWGDIPYHYGTWVEDDEAGWVWVPGYTYAPSWVDFREGPDYIGWAPVSPSFSVGVSFHVGFRPSSFIFLRSHDFLCDRVRSYAVPRSQVNVIINRTRIINNNIRIENNVVVNRGPDVRFVERATRRRIDAIPIDRTRSVRELDARGVSRQDIRVNGRDRGGRGLRAAEPVSASRPLPRGGNNRFDRTDRTDRTDRGDRNGANDRFDRSPRSDRNSGSNGGNDRFDRSPRRDRNDGADRNDRSDRSVRGGRDASRSNAPGRFERNPDRGETRGDRQMPDRTPRMRDDLQRGRDRQEAGTSEESLRRGRSDWRPDEGRMFRGVRERQPAPRAERSTPQRERMDSRDRSQGRSPSTQRSRRSSDQPRARKDQKDRDKNH